MSNSKLPVGHSVGTWRRNLSALVRIPRLTKRPVLLNSLQSVATSTWEMAHLNHYCSDMGLPFRVCSPPRPHPHLAGIWWMFP